MVSGPLTMDKVVAGCKLVASLDTFPLFCIYIPMVLAAGQWKRFTSPINLRPVLVFYNFVISAVNLYTLAGFSYGLLQSETTFEVKPSEQLRPIFKVYWITKIFELLDTVFMILRHNTRQISILHVYHHSSMLLLSDMARHHYPYPAMAPYLALNSAVHVLLYLYYGLCASSPNNPPAWKKFLTQVQILQFVLDLIHATIGYIYYTICIYGIIYGVSMLSLFSNFYYQAYVKKGSSKHKSNGQSVSNGEEIHRNKKLK